MQTLRELLTAKLKLIPGIEEHQLPQHPGFTFFEYNGKGIGHFDTDFEFDLKLKKINIAAEGLEHPRDSTNHPNRHRTKPHWIVFPFNSKKEVNNIVRLVKVAIGQA
ncbi:MAG: hypothetical protein GKR91_11225 [Pseudomonadales bacterium]|nr:hypothetical protein [Pseudomonadales bacterium]